MNFSPRVRSFLLCLLLLISFATAKKSWAQQTLGAINGTVTDTSGAAVSDATVIVTGDATGLTRTTKTQKSGYFEVLNLPIGPYTVSIAHDGFDTTKLPAIAVQEAHASTVNAVLKVGSAAESVTVNATPLLNATDTTNGYTLDRAQIEATPLATGSFTQLAILAPGVSAELLGGTGSNAGLGNQPIWANGQRDTSNTFTVNGVDVTNLFNGKSSSQSESQRINFNVGENSAPGGSTQTSTAVAGSNGNGLASPPPDFIQELRVNTSMYDAQQGTTSGAHIDVNTAGGGNKIHGSVWGTRGTDFLNSAPFFFKQDGVVPATPELHRYTAGGTVSGPVVKDKLFFFLGYQHTESSDQYAGISQFQVPFGLTDDRSTAGITAALQSYYSASGTKYTAINTYNSAAVALLNAKLPNGDFLIPSADATAQSQLTNAKPDVNLVSSSLFRADQANAALDYNVTGIDHISAKYYYQHDPATAPFGVSQTEGFPQSEDSGAQVAALNNNIVLGSKINWEQRLGFSRQKVYSNFNPALNADAAGITIPGFNTFPGLNLRDFAFNKGGTVNVGPYSAFVNAGYFENRLSPSTNVIFTLGAHTISAGANYSYNQLNIRNNRQGSAELSISNFPSFLSGKLRSGNILLGDSQRYYRSNDVGSYVQDKWQARPNLSITAGLRYDFDGPLSEKNGNLFNFDPALYSATDDTVTNSGFICAGNNKSCATPGVSDSTLKGRQWGIAPRVGFAYAPPWNHGSVVIRGGYSINYDRGELFQYLSPPAGQGISGPFGVTQEAPLASYQNFSGNLATPFGTAALPSGQVPSGTSVTQYFNGLLPTADTLRNTCTAAKVYNSSTFECQAIPYVIGDYDVNNKLPYAENWSLDFQWQPRSDLAFTLGYVGNRGRHSIIPLPFNEPQIATPGHPVNGETSSYGYQVLASTPTASCPNPTKFSAFQSGCALSTEPYDTFSGGNVDLRVPFIGYDPNSTEFSAVGVSSYDALQAHVEKRLSYGVQVGASYTYSHTLDEQSDVGLFFTGDNPSDLRSSYASSDYDRTHIVTFNYLFSLPNLEHSHNLASYFTNGWSLIGLTVLQSGQPFSIYDFSGSVGSQYFGNNIELINPILPLAPGVKPNQAKTGHSGAFYSSTNPLSSSLDPTKFQVPLVAPGSQGVPGCDATGGPGGGPLCDVYETNFVPGQRNIFRQSFQKRADISLQKVTRITEKVSARYTFDVYNLTNTPSFDIPTNNITLNPNFGELGGSAGFGVAGDGAGTQVQPFSSTTVAAPGGTTTCAGASQSCAYELYTTPGAKSNSL
ncbi:MAG TPA: carboxypeptidase regulatory-like domain-containing protein, partial [Terriglobales bacterium]